MKFLMQFTVVNLAAVVLACSLYHPSVALGPLLFIIAFFNDIVYPFLVNFVPYLFADDGEIFLKIT